MFIEKMKELRAEKGITQVEMSRKLGFSEAAYGLYETGQRQMDIPTLVEICKILNVTPNDILGF